MSQLDDAFETAKEYSWLSHLQYSRVCVNHGYARIVKIMWRIVDLSCSKTVRIYEPILLHKLLEFMDKTCAVFPCIPLPADPT